MSDVYLVIALLATFFAVVLVGVAVDIAGSERKRAVRLLEAQLASGQAVSAASLRDQELSQSFGQRALVPVVREAGRFARKLTPIDTRDKLARRLLLAGSPRGWDAERVMAFKVIGGVAGLVGGLLVSGVAGLSGIVMVVVTGLLTFVGFVLPDSIVSKLVQDRQKNIRRTLSDTLDLLTISVEAGLSLNAALSHVVQSTPGVLSQEFARMLQEVQLGVSRADAFRHLSERTDVEEMNAFTLAMIQADVFGVSISNVLRTQAQQLRIKRRQRAERLANQTPVKIVFPLILCILPALFVVIVGPGAIRIFQSLLSGS